MSPAVRVALAQMNPTVGDLDGNRQAASGWIERARAEGAHLVALPELAITGYPPEDLVLKPSFIRDNLEVIERLAASVTGIIAVVGFVDRDSAGIYNAAAVIADGEVKGIYHKHLLPNYGVFDEERYFETGEGILLGRLGDVVFGTTICEDIWSADGPHKRCASAGASLVININGSPYHLGKGLERQEMLKERARNAGVTVAYVNMTGGQDELVFDGQSVVLSPSGEVLARARQFAEELLVVDLSQAEGAARPEEASREAVRLVNLGDVAPAVGEAPQVIAGEIEEEEEVYSALVLGVSDYLRKNGFQEAIVGLSGGIDSSLTAAIAADALGPENVLGVINPSQYSSEESETLAKEVAANLGIATLHISIQEIYEAFLQALAPVFEGTEWNVAEENLQSRIRGALWMAISNKSEVAGRRRMVLATGNKSEMATGYATLYGDMVGGFGVLKDVPKTFVYRLARWRNLRGEAIPEEVIKRPPSAELRPGQLDTDALPAYEVLDPILEAYVEEDRSVEEMMESGMDEELVRRVVAMVDRAEYKRRQAAPGIKITKRAFGRDRRLPITNRYGVQDS